MVPKEKKSLIEEMLRTMMAISHVIVVNIENIRLAYIPGKKADAGTISDREILQTIMAIGHAAVLNNDKLVCSQAIPLDQSHFRDSLYGANELFDRFFVTVGSATKNIMLSMACSDQNPKVHSY